MRGSRARPEEAVRAALAGLAPATRVVLALSGGPDSTALLALTASVRGDLALRAVHVRHRLRDDVADAVAARRACRALGVPCRVVCVSVATGGEGVAGEARRARYQALERETGRWGSAVLLVAHTAEDQAETVLLALARGAGARGLSGMRPVRRLGGVRLLRPLIDVRRADLPASALPTALDPGNRDARRRRTVVRTQVLPALERVAGDAVGALGRTASLLAHDADLCDELLAEVVLPRYGPVVLLPRAVLAAAPPALASRLTRLALATVRGGTTGLSRHDVTRVLALASGRETSAGGVRVTADAAWFAFVGTAQRGIAARPLAPGRVTAVPELGAEASLRWSGDAPGEVVLRPLRRGDRRPGGSLVARALLEVGVPRAVRGFVPLLVAGQTVRWTPLDPATPCAQARGLRPPVRRDAAAAAERVRAAVVARLGALLD